MKRKRSRLFRLNRRNGDTAELASRLAPPEEQTPLMHEQAGTDGTIRVRPSKLRQLSDSSEEDDKPWMFHLHPVVRTALVLFLAYTLFVTWLIYHEPPHP